MTEEPPRSVRIALVLKAFGAAAWVLSWRYTVGDPAHLDYGQLLGDLGAAKAPSICGMGPIRTAWECLKIQARSKAIKRRNGPPDKLIPEGKLVDLNERLFK